MSRPSQNALTISRHDACRCHSPLHRREEPFVDDRRRVLVCSNTEELQPYLETGQAPPAFEMAGPRAQIFFEPATLTCNWLALNPAVLLLATYPQTYAPLVLVRVLPGSIELEHHTGPCAICGSIQAAQRRYLGESGGAPVLHHGSLRRDVNLRQGEVIYGLENVEA